MRSLLVVVVIVAASVGCHAKSPAEMCRTQAALTQMNRDLAGYANPVADSLERSRCDNLERDEIAARRDERAERREDARAQAQNQRAAMQLATVPKAAAPAPKTLAIRLPELGASYTEVALMCQNQKGTFAREQDVGVCSTKDAVLFSSAFDASGGASQIDRLFVGADLVDVRDSVIEKSGPPTRQTTNAIGRVFIWEFPNGSRVVVAMASNGVRVSSIAPDKAK